MDRAPHLVADDVARQLDALDAIAHDEGTVVRSVKPHGALYHRVASDEACAAAVAAVVRGHGSDFVVLPAGATTRTTFEQCGVRVVAEGFCDRAYLSDGTLAPRSAEGSLVVDPAEASRRAIALATGRDLEAVDGSVLKLRCDTLCVHGDTPGAVVLATAVRRALRSAGVPVAPYAGPVTA
jgi:UPF0271 protein